VGISKFESSQVSQAVRAFGRIARSAEKGPQLAGFLAFGKVSEWHIGPRGPPKSRKSPADTREIPVFGGDNGQRLGSIATAGRGRQCEAVRGGSFHENPAPYGNLFNSDDHKAAMDEIARCPEGDTRRRVPACSPNFIAGDAE
jgi:hypothetical protein